jgi:hypothetical protein
VGIINPLASILSLRPGRDKSVAGTGKVKCVVDQFGPSDLLAHPA